jgi:hypothetical protein
MPASDADRYLESPCGRFAHLPGGLCLPVEAIMVAMAIESAGFRMKRDGEDILVSPASRLTAEHRAELKRWKPFILALLDYAASREAQ